MISILLPAVLRHLQLPHLPASQSRHVLLSLRRRWYITLDLHGTLRYSSLRSIASPIQNTIGFHLRNFIFVILLRQHRQQKPLDTPNKASNPNSSSDTEVYSMR
jgi:hypothetical protein